MRWSPTGGKRALWLLLAFLPCARAALAGTVTQQPWGQTPTGEQVTLYTVRSGTAELQLTDYGARIVTIRVPDRAGKVADVVLTRDSVTGYTGGMSAVMGATLGRYANRIGGAQIEIDGVTSSLAKSNGPNTLHGGPAGFNTRVWRARPMLNGVEMTLVSSDGDMGFPGALTVHVLFRLVVHGGDARVEIRYRATTTKPTVINLSNHAFFNLAGDPDPSVYGDTLKVAADSYTPAEAGLPTGAMEPVAGTPLDFRRPRKLGDGIPERGYDSALALRSPGLREPSAEVSDPASGRMLRIYTTEPAIQLFVPSSSPPPGAPARYPPLQAFCLETEHFPDSPHHANFPSTVLRPKQVFRSTTVYAFSAATQPLQD